MHLVVRISLTARYYSHEFGKLSLSLEQIEFTKYKLVAVIADFA